MKTTIFVLLIAFTFVLSKELTTEKTVLCQPCKMGVNFIKEELKKPNEELLQTLVSGCEKLGEKLAPQCKMAVVLFGGEIINFVRREFSETSETICSKINLCKKELKKQDGALCAPCQLGVQFIKDYLEKPDDELIQILAGFCENLPSDFVGPCKAMVAIMGKELIEFVRENVNDSPRKICAQFGLCSSQIQITKNSVFCSPCKMAVQMIKDYIHKPDDELQKMLYDACTKLPDKVQQYCKAGVTWAGSYIIAYVRKHVQDSPKVICARFKLCDAETKTFNLTK
eukprot:gene10440-2962_t